MSGEELTKVPSPVRILVVSRYYRSIFLFVPAAKPSGLLIDDVTASNLDTLLLRACASS